MYSRKIQFLGICLCVLLFSGHFANANFNRHFDPVILINLPEGEAVRLMQDLKGKALNQIKVYAYHADSGWNIMPFQVDKVPFFKDMTKPFDDNDEIVFLAKDCGERVPDDMWIDDATSRNYHRYEIAVVDTVTDDSAFAYIYLTDVPETHPVPFDYMEYEVKRDRVKSIYYEIGSYEDSPNYNFENLIIPQSAGGGSVDFLDRLKIRIKVTISVFNLGTIVRTEEDLKKPNDDPVIYHDGCVRVIKKWVLNLKTIEPFDDAPVNFPLVFYPYFTKFAFDIPEQDIDQYGSIDYVRLSMDLNPFAMGMKMFSSIRVKSKTWMKNFPNGVPIDNKSDIGLNPRSLNITGDGWNWWMQTGSPGTILTICKVSDIGHWQQLYYMDYPSGTNDTDQSIEDTGYNGSWGDTGMKFSYDIKTPLSLAATYLLLGGNISPDSADTIMNQFASPLDIRVVESAVVPVELTDFHAVSIEDRVTLTWRTATETNNLGFALQRKSPDQYQWQDIGFVKGAGTTARARSYQYKDEPNLYGAIQYRLKQQDFDGSIQYSPIASVFIQTPSRFELMQNYPNPFNPNTMISYRVPAKTHGFVNLTIYDLLGRQVRTLVNVSAQPGYFRIEWDGQDDSGANVAGGVYWCVLKTAQETQARKMLKLP